MRPQTPSALIVWLWRVVFLGAAAAGAAVPGCSGSTGPDSAKTGESAASTLPVASIAGTTDTAPSQPPEPPAGTAEAVLNEAKRLRVAPFPEVTSPEQIAQFRLDRQKELVRLATEVIAKTHNDPEKARLFDDAAFLLMSSRLELALCDEPAIRDENIDAIYEHASAFYQRDPESKAAAEAAFTVARLAHENARVHGTTEWFIEFARQAQVFATKFPREQTRAASLLFSAGWSCELQGLEQPATNCYSMIVKEFPNAKEAVAAAGSLRRLKLVGQPIQLGGSTFDGGYVSIDEFAGKSVLVVFWQAGNPKMHELMPVLADLQRTSGDGLAILGIALDEDEASIESFLASYPLEWKQIFFADPDKRGWKNTIAEFYGVTTVPAVWLIDPDGRVRATNLTAETARQAVAVSSR